MRFGKIMCVYGIGTTWKKKGQINVVCECACLKRIHSTKCPPYTWTKSCDHEHKGL